ncbi:hypothetical protein [Roseococcus pinisoli]|uniref:Copper-binding protein n=1 Tax=Roseococcus pinisoli TaxID=2835040 RepID=A0ABS5QE79_9PROT|nr:hypothetical protein [Roseococcus pinisoli]MBS7811847.1 hypothetical protein [Roseococcus pinisoli]
MTISLASLLLATGLMLPGMAQQPASVERTLETRSTVETVDAQARTILLRDATGGLSTYDIDRDVPDLARIRPGDQVVVNYRVGVVASMARPGSRPAIDETVNVDNPPLGTRPGESVQDTVRMQVRIESVDPATSTVSFVGPRGVPRRVVLRSPQMQAFARDLKPGDEVEVAYTEARAIRIEPVRP